MPALVRAAVAADAGALRDIERRAGERFRDVDLPAVADDEPLSAGEITRYAEAGRAWVATVTGGHPAGYVLIDVVDGCAHVEQVSVDPDQQGKGVGRALLERVRAWAIETGLPAVTLTTFADVPWNAPLYRHIGFRELDEDEIGVDLRAVRDREARHGLDPATRVCMRWEAAGP